MSISELVLAVNIALGNRQLADCLPADPSGDGRVGVEELVTAVRNALNSCPE